MATVFKSDQITNLTASPVVMVKPSEAGGRKRVMFFTITLASSGLATGDSIQLGYLPKGARVIGGRFAWDTAQGASATMAIGITGTTGKYFTAAVTNALTSVIFADTIVQNFGTITTALETVLATNAVAAWTASSILRGQIEYIVD